MAFATNVFINCPFDIEYQNLLRPMIFSILYMGLTPKIAILDRDCSSDRLSKIERLIKESRYSIHDLSRMESSEALETYRMNMPFELGIDYGFKKSNASRQLQRKKFLILERKKYQYKKAISDISGWDIECHNDDSATLVRIIRDWFIENQVNNFSGAYTEIWGKYNDSTNAVWEKMGRKGKKGQSRNNMPINEYISFIKTWILNNKR